MPKLNPNAQKWVDALRSGKYKQGKHRLRTGDTFCCLGVACDVLKKEAKLRWLKRNAGQDDEAYVIGGKDADLPLSVMQLLGIKTANGSLPQQETLAGFNDYRNATFQQIADLIESHAIELGVAGRETELAEVGQ